MSGSPQCRCRLVRAAPPEHAGTMTRAQGWYVAAAVHAAATLVVPVACGGCGAVDVACCDQCRELWQFPGHRVEQGAGRLDRMTGERPLPVWALARYEAAARATVVAAKDGGRHDLHPMLCAALRAEAARRRLLLHEWAQDRRLVVIPVPSSSRSIRKRGVDVVDRLARSVAIGLGASHTRALAARSAKRDQVGLDRQARHRNVRESLRRRADRGWRGPELPWSSPPGRRPAVVLVDDVLTTGATLAVCTDLLQAVGMPVISAFVLAATRPPDAQHSATGA